MTMVRRPLGRTGMMVSAFCFGTWELGGLYWGPVAADDAVALLRHALDRGVTVYDCSDSYGNGRSEVLLSVAFDKCRHDVTYVTKVGYLGGLDGAQSVRSPLGARDQDYSPEYIKWACELSLRRLNTDYIDVYLLHDPPSAVLYDSAPFEALRDLEKDGKIRAYGVSSSVHGAAMAVRRHGAQVVMVPLNLLNQEASTFLLPMAANRGVGVLARSPFAGGLLLDDVLAAAPGTTPFSPLDGRSALAPERLQEARVRAEQFRFLYDARADRLSSAAVKYVLSHRDVATVVTGVMRLEELQQNLDASCPPYFDEELLNTAHAQSALMRAARSHGEIHAAH